MFYLKRIIKIVELLENNIHNTIILGPSSASVFRVNNIYRFGIILKYKKEETLKEVLNKVLEHYKGNVKIKIDIDFNPSQIY